MRRVAFFVAALALVLTACGLKVPATIIAGSGEESGPGDDTVAADVLDDETTVAGDAADGDVTATDDVTGQVITEDGVVSSNLFPNEVEGITQDQITVCAHVPITGAAPIPHHKNRFGQFYFDYVNNELGGIYGRNVRYLVFDDQYYPAGARAAMERCYKEGAFIYLGAAGTDQIVSVAKWAERKKVPYFHGPTSIKDLGGFTYNVHSGPSYEYQHYLLADYLVDRFGTDVDYGMIRVNSPYFDAGHDAFVSQLKKHGITLSVDRVVQKDERNFSDTMFELSTGGSKGGAGVEVINNFATPNHWITMLKQKPATYNPWWTAVSPVAGFNILAAALADSNGRAVVFQHFMPACNCTDYQRDLDTSLPWAPDIKRMLAIFKKYSPEQNPPPDDFDYSAYLAAQALQRILLKLGPHPTRTGLWELLPTYKEDAKKVFPACGADFTRSPEGERIGAWSVNIFELKLGKWKQIETCVDEV